MKKFIFASLMAIGALSAQAQNIQLHYDFGRSIYSNEEAGRPKVTVTLEQFKADEWGSWFYFVDIDMSRHFTESGCTLPQLILVIIFFSLCFTILLQVLQRCTQFRFLS